MRYVEFRDAILSELRRSRSGLTWTELRERLDLPYRSPCYEWLRRMEREDGLTRTPGGGRALVWRVS
jgi:hypothetical protein